MIFVAFLLLYFHFVHVIYSLFAVVFWIIALISGHFATNLSQYWQNCFCIISPSCLNISINALAKYESSLIGLQWNNISDVYSDFQFQTSIIMFFIDYVVYVLVAVYLDKVLPTKYGTKRESFYYCCLPSFWNCNKCCFNANSNGNKSYKHQSSINLDHISTNDVHLLTSPLYAELPDSPNCNNNPSDIPKSGAFENVNINANKKASVSLRNLTKIFGSHKAVDAVSLNLYQGEVFCLLGHNGML